MTDLATHLNNEHKAAYQSERPVRWSMEDNQALSVTMTFLDVVSACLGLPRHRVEVRRLDDYWFDVYAPDSVEWVKGCPDYFGLIFSGNIRFLFFELKIKKDGEFRLTKNGGRTKSGTNITKYGCTSFYLDIVPVLRNMNDFCDTTGLPKDKFQVLFAEPGAGIDGINLISLADINQMIAEGWNGIPIQKYGEGYGQSTYLIPRDAMTALSKLSAAKIREISSDKSILPDLMANSGGLIDTSEEADLSKTWPVPTPTVGAKDRQLANITNASVSNRGSPPIGAPATSTSTNPTDVVMPDWKHKGSTLGHIHQIDPGYLQQVIGWSKAAFHPGLIEAIKKVIAADA